MRARIAQPRGLAWAAATGRPARLDWVEQAAGVSTGGRVSEIEESGYRSMVAEQNDAQIDTWAADLFIDFAKRLGVGNAITAFCQAAGLDARGFQRAFLVGGG